MKKWFVFFLVPYLFVYGQEDFIKNGTLQNGLTYYLKSTSEGCERKSKETKRDLFVLLLVKVGISDGKKEEKGLAHLLEHVIVTEWKKSDALHVREAYVNHTCTGYKIKVPLEGGDFGNLEKLFCLLRNVLTETAIKKDIVDREKKIVLEELLLEGTKHDARRLPLYHLNQFLEQSPYQEAISISRIKKINEKATCSILQKFYTTWYRPDRMAIVVSGEFDVDLAEKALIQALDELEVSQEKEEPYLLPSLYKTDNPLPFPPFLGKKEIGFSGQVYVPLKRCDFSSEKDVEPLTQVSFRDFFIELLKRRLPEALFTLKNRLRFFDASIDLFFLQGLEELLAIRFQGVAKHPELTVLAIVREVNRMKQVGPTRKEVKDFLKSSAFLEKDFFKEASDHFIFGKPFYRKLSLDQVAICSKAFIDAFSEKFCSWVKREIDLRRAYKLFFISPDISPLSQKKMEEAFFDEKILAKTPCKIPFFDELKKKKQELVVKDFGEELLLGNGLAIGLFPEEGDDLVEIKLLAEGGWDVFSEEDYGAVFLASHCLQLYGFVNSDPITFAKHLVKKGIACELHIKKRKREIRILGSKKELKTLFQLIHAIFSKSQKSCLYWDHMKDFCILGKSHATCMDRLLQKESELLFGKEFFYYYQLPASLIQKAKKKRGEACLKKLFFSPAQFSMSITGSFTKEEVIPFIKTYLNFPKCERSLKKFVLPKIPDRKERLSEAVLYDEETLQTPYSLHLISYPITLSEEEDFAWVKPFENIVYDRVSDKLRNELKGVYQVKVQISQYKAPYKRILMRIYFGCQTERGEAFKKEVVEMVKSLAEKGFKEEEKALLAKNMEPLEKDCPSIETRILSFLQTFLKEEKPVQVSLILGKKRK